MCQRLIIINLIKHLLSFRTPLFTIFPNINYNNHFQLKYNHYYIIMNTFVMHPRAILVIVGNLLICNSFHISRRYILHKIIRAPKVGALIIIDSVDRLALLIVLKVLF